MLAVGEDDDAIEDIDLLSTFNSVGNEWLAHDWSDVFVWKGFGARADGDEGEGRHI